MPNLPFFGGGDGGDNTECDTDSPKQKTRPAGLSFEIVCWSKLDHPQSAGPAWTNGQNLPGPIWTRALVQGGPDWTTA